MSMSYPFRYQQQQLGAGEYARRRETLMSLMEEDSIAIVPSAGLQIRSNDTEYRFRQDSDFYYLTGFLEPDAVLVLLPGRKQGQVLYFCRDKNPERELWDGFREGPAGVCANYGGDDAFPIDDIDEILPGLMEGRERVYYAMGRRRAFDNRVMEWLNALRAKLRAGAHPPGEFLDLDHVLHDMRLFKSRNELKLMRAAASISCQAHAHAMAVCEPGMNEGQLEAEYLYQFAVRGASAPAYSTIVGAGANACVLHYIENNQRIANGDLVLVDAGCEYQGYAADITRTFPANGKFSAPQQALYEVVLEAQLASIAAARVGNHWDEPHDASVQVITQGLLDLGLLDGEFNELIETEAYKRFYMHRVGHWLGLDVHDVGDYKVHGEWRVLEPGMVMTIEPGIYVPSDDRSVAAKWRGIGIRIEDNVLIKQKGVEILTEELAKTVAEVEAAMRAPVAFGPAAVQKAKAKKAPRAKVAATKKAATKKAATKNKVTAKKAAAKKVSTKRKAAAVKKPASKSAVAKTKTRTKAAAKRSAATAKAKSKRSASSRA